MNDSNTSGSEQDVWTDFETEEGRCGSISVDENFVWGAYCPQPDCKELNIFEGPPSEFANRPYRCVECDWVSLMDDSVSDIQCSLNTETDR
jgi:hypothetical protein